MSIDSAEDLAGLRAVGRIVANCLVHMKNFAKPGMTTAELDAEGARFLAAHGARSAPKITYDFPGATCISLNEESAYGLPGPSVLRDGDLVNIDVSAEKDGFFADTGGSFILGTPSPRKQKVITGAKKALASAIRIASDGAALKELGRAMENAARKEGLTNVRNLGSHGVGRGLHEEPKFIPGYHDPKEKRRLRKGQVITLEPFVSDGAEWVEENGDGWTLVNPGHFTAQFEHTLVITDGAPLIMTVPDQGAFF